MLQLRMQTDPLFKEYKYEDFHVERYQGGLAIKGDCGEPIYFIKGLEISSRLNKEERSYLVKIINDLLINDSTFKETVKVRRQLKEIRDQIQKFSNKTNVSMNRYYSGVLKLSKWNKNKRIRAEYENGKISYASNIGTTKKDLEEFLKTERDLINDFIIYEALFEEETKLNKKLSTINSCNV